MKASCATEEYATTSLALVVVKASEVAHRIENSAITSTSVW